MTLSLTIMLKTDLSLKGKLLVYQLIYILTQNRRNTVKGLWGLPSGTRRGAQTSKESYKVKLLHLCVEKRRMTWFRMLLGFMPTEVFQARSIGKTPPGQNQKKPERLHILPWPGNSLGFPRRYWRAKLGRRIDRQPWTTISRMNEVMLLDFCATMIYIMSGEERYKYRYFFLLVNKMSTFHKETASVQ